MMFNRRKTSQIQVGKVGIGSNFPISVQSMTTTKTRDVDGTLAQIYEIASNGADIVRVTCNEVEAAQGLVEITQRSPVPIIADIHFQYKLALAAIEYVVVAPANFSISDFVPLITDTAAACFANSSYISSIFNASSLASSIVA